MSTASGKFSKPETEASNPYSISGMVQKEKVGSSQSSDPSEVIYLNVSDIFANLHRAAKLVFFPCLSIYLQFVATFLVFPGLMSTVRYRGIDRTIEQDFFSFLNLTFSIADLAGRLVAPIHSPLSDYQLLIYSISRFMWAPLCFGLAKEWNGFETDFITWIIMLGFGFTNGHVVALCTMASSRIKESERELAGFVTIACLHFGIVTGSNLALIFEATS